MSNALKSAINACDYYINKSCPIAKEKNIKSCRICEECLWRDDALIIYKAFLKGAKYMAKELGYKEEVNPIENKPFHFISPPMENKNIENLKKDENIEIEYYGEVEYIDNWDALEEDDIEEDNNIYELKL